MNKDKFSWFLKKFFFIHPVAIVLIFIINSYELVKFNKAVSNIEIVFSIILSILFLLLSYFSFKKLFKNVYKAAIITTFVLIYCLFYWYIFTLANSIRAIQIIEKYAFFNHHSIALLVSFLLLSIILVIYLKRSSANLLKFTWFLNVLSVSFLLTMLIQNIQANKFDIKLTNNEKLTVIKSVKSEPNIYYIILDSYTGNTSLKSYWNFDNSEFSNFLKSKGFYIANSSSNYNFTPFSLASSLNMSYLNQENKGKKSRKCYYDLLNLIKDSRAINFLKNKGYKIINYSFFDVADQQRSYEDHFFLKDNFFSRSVFTMLYSGITDIKDQDELKNLPAENLIIVNRAKNLALDSTKHYFVYVHLLLPHFPYFYDHNGKKMPLRYANDDANKNKYLEQLRFTNKLIADCIETILRDSITAPIIIIQGDHGFRFLQNKDQLSESFSILNAYFFPDKDYSSLYGSVSPVNSFRIILNKYFGTRLNLLKDLSNNVYISSN